MYIYIQKVFLRLTHMIGLISAYLLYCNIIDLFIIYTFPPVGLTIFHLITIKKKGSHHMDYPPYFYHLTTKKRTYRASLLLLLTI